MFLRISSHLRHIKIQLEQWSPVAQEVPIWTNWFLTSFSSIELSCTKPRRRKDPEGRKPTPIFLALRDLLGKLSGPIQKSLSQICLFQKARHWLNAAYGLDWVLAHFLSIWTAYYALSNKLNYTKVFHSTGMIPLSELTYTKMYFFITLFCFILNDFEYVLRK